VVAGVVLSSGRGLSRAAPVFGVVGWPCCCSAVAWHHSDSRPVLLIRPAHTWGSQSDGRRARSDGQGRRRAEWESRAASLRAPRKEIAVRLSPGRQAAAQQGHASGDKYYGQTKRGAYVCQSAAQNAGYHLAK
jgi:hypothetical protein